MTDVAAESVTNPAPDRDLPYRNPALPIDQRVNDLLSRLTLEEKAGHPVLLPGHE